MSQRPTRRAGRQPPPPPKRSMRPYLIGAGIIFVLLLIMVLVTQRGPTPPRGVLSFDGLGREHVTGPVTYPQHPPVGGDHAPQWQNCGFYASSIPNETAVHSMEHGAVWITYRPDLPQDQINRLRQIVAGQSFVLASSVSDLTAPVIASTWGRQIHLESAEDPKLEQFITAFKQGPNTPERGAPCGGGVGTPR